MDSILTRKEREREARRDAILVAARSVISEKGFARATLEEIATKAEFGKGTLYNYFEGGKEEILFTIIDEMYSDVQVLISKLLESETSKTAEARDVLRQLILELLRYYTDRRDTFIILVKEVQRLLLDEDAKAGYFLDQRNKLIDTMVGPLQKFIDEGHVKPLPARAVANMILGNIHGCQMHTFLEKSDDTSASCSPEANAEFLSTMLLDGLLASDLQEPIK